MPPREIMAISVVPPPISTIILPLGSVMLSPAPMAAAMGSSINEVCLAPACIAASSTARFPHSLRPTGRTNDLRFKEPGGVTLLIKCRASSRSHHNQQSRCPSRGELLQYFRRTADHPRLFTNGQYRLVSFSGYHRGLGDNNALPRTKTSTLAVPGSIPISVERFSIAVFAPFFPASPYSSANSTFCWKILLFGPFCQFLFDISFLWPLHPLNAALLYWYRGSV